MRVLLFSCSSCSLNNRRRLHFICRKYLQFILRSLCQFPNYRCINKYFRKQSQFIEGVLDGLDYRFHDGIHTMQALWDDWIQCQFHKIFFQEFSFWQSIYTIECHNLQLKTFQVQSKFIFSFQFFMNDLHSTLSLCYKAFRYPKSFPPACNEFRHLLRCWCI